MQVIFLALESAPYWNGNKRSNLGGTYHILSWTSRNWVRTMHHNHYYEHAHFPIPVDNSRQARIRIFGKNSTIQLEFEPKTFWLLLRHLTIKPLGALPDEQKTSYITALLRGLSQISTNSHSLRAGTELAHWLNFATSQRSRHDTLWCPPSRTVLVSIGWVVKILSPWIFTTSLGYVKMGHHKYTHLFWENCLKWKHIPNYECTHQMISFI